MRSGGPRLFCSPYFVTALFALLVLASMKYYSVTTDNETLTLRLEVLQNQMKMTATNLNNLDASVNKKSEALLDCNNDRIQAEVNSRKAKELNEKKEELIERLKDELNSKQKTLEKIQSENVNLYVANDSITDSIQRLQEELNSERGKNRNLEKIVQESLAVEERNKKLQEDLEAAKAELVALKSERVQGKESISIQDPEYKFSPKTFNLTTHGQRPDVNPDSAQIQQPALQGNTFHQDANGKNIPIPPRGNPHGPRPSPRFRVGQEPTKPKDGNEIKSFVKNASGDKKKFGKPNMAVSPQVVKTDLDTVQDDLPDEVVEVETSSVEHQFIAAHLNNKEAQRDVSKADAEDEYVSKGNDHVGLDSQPLEDKEDFEMKLHNAEDDPDTLNSMNKLE